MYEKFAEILKEKNLTAYKVAKGTSLTPTLFSDWKSGKSKPKADKLLKIANYLEVPVEELIEKE